MVGTVSYMPPEQAMGGEVTARSDLAAMLLEMVCGRPPFVGDESVAIICQHLNTAPVALSWHRPGGRGNGRVVWSVDRADERLLRLNGNTGSTFPLRLSPSPRGVSMLGS